VRNRRRDRITVPIALISAGQLEKVKAVLWARLAAPVVPAVATNGHGADRLLTAQEVRARTTLSVAWLYRHAGALPFTRRVGRTVLFSEAGLTKWLATRWP
jgi:predicted DNA-binding transcriptional regulator AlpA